jgi:membrane fusion protein, heavy metal efflux system
VSNRARRGIRTATFSAATVSLLLLGACGAGRSEPQTQSAGQLQQDQAGYFTVPSNQLDHLHIEPVRKDTWQSAIHTTGTVDWDADHTTSVISQVSGPVVRILAHPGTVVKAGDALLDVSSPDISGAISAYRRAVTRRDFAKRTLDRNRDLLAHEAIAKKDLESSQADFDDAAAEVEGDIQALKIYGIGQPEIEQSEKQGVPIDPELSVRSPIAGVVVQQLVMPGQLIQAGATACFLVSDVSTVWVQGHVFDKDLDSIRVGDRVEVTDPSFSTSRSFPGVVSYIGAITDPITRTTPVRVVTRNPNGVLKKDMFVDLAMHTSVRRGVLTVPVSAVLHDPQNEPFVYVEVAPGRFAQRQIAVGAEQDGAAEILSGCKEGERVVSEGSVFLQFANSSQ